MTYHHKYVDVDTLKMLALKGRWETCRVLFAHF